MSWTGKEQSGQDGVLREKNGRQEWKKYFVCFEFGLQVVYGLVKTIVTSLMFEPS